MHIERGSIIHRLVGLFMAVLMPLCCCSTQVFGEAVLDETSTQARVVSCCSHCLDSSASDSEDSSNSHDRCDCVRGQLGGGVDTTTIIGSLSSPAVAHPCIDWAFVEIGGDSNPAEPLATVTRPPDDPGTTPSARKLRRIVILQN